MSLQVQGFSKEVVSSYANTRTFLEGKSTLIEIAKQRDLFLNQPLYFTSQHRNLGRGWKIIHALTYPIRLIISYHLSIIAIFVSALSRPLGLRMHKVAKRIKIGFRNLGLITKTNTYAIGPCTGGVLPTKFQSCAQIDYPDVFLPLVLNRKEVTKRTLLSWTENEARKELTKVLSEPPHKITDVRIKKRALSSKVSCMQALLRFRGTPFLHLLPTMHLELRHEKGVCRGMSLWFLYLYLQTKHLYADTQKHMAVLSQIFAEGAPIEAVLLHSINVNKGKIMNLEIGKNETWFSEPVQTVDLIEVDGKRQIKDPSVVEKELANLKVGAYRCHFPNHCCVFIKTSENLSYWFDPNFGVVEISGPDQAAQLFYELNDPNYFGDKRYTSNAITLYSVQLRESALHIGPTSPAANHRDG
jgi:hypothetical protein